MPTLIASSLILCPCTRFACTCMRPVWKRVQGQRMRLPAYRGRSEWAYRYGKSSSVLRSPVQHLYSPLLERAAISQKLCIARPQLSTNRCIRSESAKSVDNRKFSVFQTICPTYRGFIPPPSYRGHISPLWPA